MDFESIASASSATPARTRSILTIVSWLVESHLLLLRLDMRRAFILILLSVCSFAITPATHALSGGNAAICAPSNSDSTANVNAGDLDIFHPASPPARKIRDLAWLVLGITAGIFIVVESVLVWSIIRFRSRKAQAGEPVQVFGSNPVELAWTIIPCVIVFVLALATVRTIREVELEAPPAGALEVDVIGHQWWWEYRLPSASGTTIVTANELVVPVGRPVWLNLRSADVIHSWWVPRLAGKTDVIPNHVNHTWFEAEAQGTYLGQCAEYCGTQHANMLLRVRVVSDEAFEGWCNAQLAPTVEDASVNAGRALFAELACMNCHTVDGLSVGAFGPNLTHLMSRETIGAGVAPLNPETLRAWVDDPQNLKIGCNMPSLKLEGAQLDAVVAFLLTLK